MIYLKRFWIWLSGLFGNNPKVIAMIFVFLIILVFFAVRCSAQTSAHLAAGMSFGCLAYAPVLALDVDTVIDRGFGWNVGTTLWGRDHDTRNNFDLHARIEFARGAFGAGIGPAYLQNIDSVDGSHLNFNLLLFWRPWRVGAEVSHISNGGTSLHNCGRNALLADVRLR